MDQPPSPASGAENSAPSSNPESPVIVEVAHAVEPVSHIQQVVALNVGDGGAGAQAAEVDVATAPNSSESSPVSLVDTGGVLTADTFVSDSEGKYGADDEKEAAANMSSEEEKKTMTMTEIEEGFIAIDKYARNPLMRDDLQGLLAQGNLREEQIRSLRQLREIELDQVTRKKSLDEESPHGPASDPEIIVASNRSSFAESEAPEEGRRTRSVSSASTRSQIDLGAILNRNQSIETQVDSALADHQQKKSKKKKKKPQSTEATRDFTTYLESRADQAVERSRSLSNFRPAPAANPGPLSQDDLQQMISSAHLNKDQFNQLLKNAPANSRKLEKMVEKVEVTRRNSGLLSLKEEKSPSLRSSVTGRDLPLRIVEEDERSSSGRPQNLRAPSVDDILKDAEMREKKIKQRIDRSRSPSASGKAKGRKSSTRSNPESPQTQVEPPPQDFVARPPRRSCCAILCCRKRYAVFEEDVGPVEEPSRTAQQQQPHPL
eukprot:TRINITY_DN63378_c0_g2_i3.p1 TRINITY_DN63378_c0_g2~~TRINITY_DN63378_c0_g2_i3.p1  ORF type:complete len:502 (+),score=125.70 TRINITY_DN63378_c0_g2_i3:38-1507(+)